MDGGVWSATVHRIAKGWTRLSDFTFHLACLQIGSEGSGHKGLCPAHPMTSPQWGSASGPRAQLEGTLQGDPQEGLLPTGGHLPVATARGYNRWA